MRKGKYSRRRGGGLFSKCMSQTVIDTDQSTLHTDRSEPNYITSRNLKQIFQDAFVNYHDYNYIIWPSNMLQLTSVGLRFTPQSQVFIKFGDKVAQLRSIKVPTKNQILVKKTNPPNEFNEFKLEDYLTFDKNNNQFMAAFEIELYVILYKYIEEPGTYYECTIELFDGTDTPVRAFREANMNTSQRYNCELWNSEREQPELRIAQNFTTEDEETIQSYFRKCE